jgi:hypothetical protein
MSGVCRLTAPEFESYCRMQRIPLHEARDLWEQVKTLDRAFAKHWNDKHAADAERARKSK